MIDKQWFLKDCDDNIENSMFKIIRYKKRMLDPEFDAENIKTILIPFFENRISNYKKLKSIIENFWDKEI